MNLNIVRIYIAKNFLIKFFQICFGFFLLIFFINFLEIIQQDSGGMASIWAMLAIAFLKVPDFLNDVAPSLVLLSAIASFYSLSLRSEITVIRMSGFSLWQTVQPIAISAFCLGIFWITLFNLVSIEMLKKSNSLENKYLSKELRETFIPIGGIWLKQQNMDKENGEVIIRTSRVFRDNMEMENVTMWFFDENGFFYKKIDAKRMMLEKKYWLLKGAIINDEKLTNEKLEQFKVPTNLEAEFIKQKILNNFQNPKFFSLFELPQLIKDLRLSGLNPTKFEIYFNLLLCKPIIFVAMSLIACYFGLSHFRNQRSVIITFIGIATGLVFYITTSITNALGSSGLIPVFSSTWLISLICLSVGILLIYRKENL